MSRHEGVEQHDDKKLKHRLEDRVQLSEEYAGGREQFLNMLTK